MFKIIIDGNCNLKSLNHFDSIATMSGLYNYSIVIVDLRKSISFDSFLNKEISVLLPEQISKDRVSLLTKTLSKGMVEKRIASAYFSCDEFSPPTLFFNRYHNIKTLDKNKIVSLENLSLIDIDIIKEYYKKSEINGNNILLSNPFYSTIKLTSENEILLNENFYCKIDEFTIKKSIELFELIFNNKKIINNYIKETENAYNIIDEKVNSVFYSKDMFLFNDTFSTEEIVNYKKKIIDFAEQVKNEKNIKCPFEYNIKYVFYETINKIK